MRSSMPPLFGRRASRDWNPLTLAVLAALWIATLCNWPLWRALWALPETASLRGALFMAAFAGMVAALTAALLGLAAWRRAIKPAIALFLLSAALGAHFMGTYGIVIDPTMMINVLQTDPRESLELMNLRLLVSVAVLAGLPLMWLWRARVRRLRWAAQAIRNLAVLIAAVALLAGLLIASFADLSSTMRNHKSMRYQINPLNSFWALGTLAREANARPKGPPQPVGADARLAPRPAGAKPPLLMLVVGETARADHFSLNGYARVTDPGLTERGVVSFRDVTSCGTNTAASLPCMFSHLGRDGFHNRDGEHESLLDAAQRAGLAVLWVDNQSGCKGVCDRVPYAMAVEAPAGAVRPTAPWCHSGECMDEALLLNLDTRLAALPAQRRERGVLLVLHQMGSHGPAYYKRSPPERKPFQPECTTNVLQQCDRATLVNTYDNSIAYTDHVLSRAIDWLLTQTPRFDPALLYVSDHGESLGENNLYLHGLPYAVAPREQKHVPMIVWLAPQTERASGIRMACLREQRDTALSHDHLFHTVAGLLGVQMREYRRELDAFLACRSG